MINVYSLYTNPTELEVPDFGDDAIAAFDFAYEYLGPYNIRNSKIEQIISKSPSASCDYAVNILRDRFELGEPMIAMVASRAFEYAWHVLEHAWPEAEHVIAKNPLFTFQYAFRVLKHRFIMGEDVLLNGPRVAQDEYLWLYIKNII